MTRNQTENHLTLHGWIPLEHPNASAYKQINPTWATVVRVEVALDNPTGRLSQAISTDNRMEDIRRFRKQADWGYICDRFFWLMWERICVAEFITDDRTKWGRL